MRETAELAAYVLSGTVDEWSMHLALKKKEQDEWTSLNFGIGVLYAEADFGTEEFAGTTNILTDVSLVRFLDGTFGVYGSVARQKDFMENKEVKPYKTCFWTSRDMVHFRQQDVKTVEQDKITVSFEKRNITVGQAVLASVLTITEKEAQYLCHKLGKIENIGVEPIEISASCRQTISLPPLTAHYSDGSKVNIPVKWDEHAVAELMIKRQGTYEIHGKAQVLSCSQPMIEGIADPMICFYKGNYYLTGTNEYTSGCDLYIRCAKTIEELPMAEPVCYFHATKTGEHSGCNWAPELHVIGGELYCLFASSMNGEWNTVQSRIMHCKGNPMVTSSWQACERIRKQDGTYLIEQGITLDMTYFEVAGNSYYCWAQRDIAEEVGTSDLYIARVNPENPAYLASEPIRLLKPKYAWDRQHTTVDEGPNVLKHEGRLYMTFSGDSVSDYYCLGMLIADEDSDLLNPESWQEIGYPVLGRQHVSTERGPGHNAFTKDEFGRDVLVYHMKPNGGMRSFCTRLIHYGFDGTPLLYMTPEKYLKPEYRNVTAKITLQSETV